VKIKKSLSMFMIGIMIFSNIPVSVMADDTNTCVDILSEDLTTSGSAISVSNNNIDVSFNITGQWNDGFNGEITINNLTDKVIENWQIQMEFQQEITNIWNAAIVSHNGMLYNIKNAGGNNNVNIPANGSVTFGFSGIYKEDIIAPENVVLTSGKTKADKDIYSVKYTLLSDWGDGYTGQITITNNTDRDIEGWHLTFNFDREITSIWNAVVEKHNGNKYYIANAGYNSVIYAGESITLGFNGISGDKSKEPNNYDLTQASKKSELAIYFDEDMFTKNEDGKLYNFGKLECLSGAIDSIYGISSATYSIKYGEYETSSGTLSYDNNGNWKIDPVYLMADSGYVEYGNTITVDVEDIRGNKAQKTIVIHNYYYNDDFYNRLDFSDNDGDGLFNYEEDIYGTDINNSDTDNDGLNDCYELKFTLTDPLLYDTDGNGIPDSDEDFDNDTLTNKEESNYSSDPYSNDTDSDGLYDSDEISNNTDIGNKDTDSDGLFDSKELELGTNPLNPDTDGNGILDGDEKYTKIYSPALEETDERVIPTLELTANPNVINTLEITKVDDSGVLVDDMPGFLGYAYEFEMAGTFEEAKLTYSFDPQYLEIDNFEPVIYYFNENKQILEPVADQSADLYNCKVTANLEHFSEYILLNKTEFEKAWQEEIIAPVGDLRNSLDVVLCIDSSGSMDWNDRNKSR